MNTSQRGKNKKNSDEKQNVESFFQDCIMEIDEPIDEKLLEKLKRKCKAMRNELYVLYNDGRETIAKQINEINKLIEERRNYRQRVIDNSRKDVHNVKKEYRQIKLILDEIEDISEQCDLETEKQRLIKEQMEAVRQQIHHIEVERGSQELISYSEKKACVLLENRISKTFDMYNKELGIMRKAKLEILQIEKDHQKFISYQNNLEMKIAELRDKIIPTLKSVKPILKKRSEFVNKAANSRMRNEKQKQLELEQIESYRRIIDHESKLHKHLIEKNRERQRLKQKNKTKPANLWDDCYY